MDNKAMDVDQASGSKSKVDYEKIEADINKAKAEAAQVRVCTWCALLDSCWVLQTDSITALFCPYL